MKQTSIGAARALLFILMVPCTDAAENSASEYRDKARFLLKFFEFIDWPQRNEYGPWVIGVFGKDPFGAALEEAASARTARNRPIIVRHYKRTANLHGCHILFIPRAEAFPARALLEPGLLTVGETPLFLESGGVVNLYYSGADLHFELSAESAKNAKLRVSAHLMRLGCARELR